MGSTVAGIWMVVFGPAYPSAAKFEYCGGVPNSSVNGWLGSVTTVKKSNVATGSRGSVTGHVKYFTYSVELVHRLPRPVAVALPMDCVITFVPVLGANELSLKFAPGCSDRARRPAMRGEIGCITLGVFDTLPAHHSVLQIRPMFDENDMFVSKVDKPGMAGPTSAGWNGGTISGSIVQKAMGIWRVNVVLLNVDTLSTLVYVTVLVPSSLSTKNW